MYTLVLGLRTCLGVEIVFSKSVLNVTCACGALSSRHLKLERIFWKYLNKKSTACTEFLTIQNVLLFIVHSYCSETYHKLVLATLTIMEDESLKLFDNYLNSYGLDLFLVYICDVVSGVNLTCFNIVCVDASLEEARYSPFSNKESCKM